MFHKTKAIVVYLMAGACFHVMAVDDSGQVKEDFFSTSIGNLLITIKHTSEFKPDGGAPYQTEIERSFYGKATVSF